MPDKRSTHQLASTLDATELPALAVDILRWRMGHSRIRILDGPGDGRRDILSVRPDGKEHLTQCKYHRDASATVSSRETDEIVIALAKFGIKCATFVTNSDISPQGKREYIDNFPGYELDYIDGTDLVRHIEESPLLSRMWLHGSTIGMTTHRIVIPFVARDGDSDSSIKSDLEHDASFENYWASQDSFEPYRPPSGRTDRECAGHGSIDCLAASEVRRLSLFELPYAVSQIKQAVLQSIALKRGGCVTTVRFSKPALTNSTSESEQDLIWLGGIEPESFVISKKGKIETEKHWLVPELSGSWTYPENISVLEVPWSGWYSTEHEGMLMCNMTWPIVGDHHMWCFAEAQRAAVMASLFVASPDALVIARLESLEPDWSERLGEAQVLGWLHPYLRPDETGDRGSVSVNGRECTPIHSDAKSFEEQLVKLRGALTEMGLAEFPPERAIHLAAATGEPFIDELPKVESAPSAQILEYFEEIPSPVFLLDRSFSFIQTWELDDELKSAREAYVTRWCEPEIEDVSIEVDIKIGSATQRVFVFVFVGLRNCGSESATDHAQRLIEKLPLVKEMLQAAVCATWSSANLATQRFWQTEVGMSFEGNKIIGKPWVMMMPSDDAPPEQESKLYIVRPESSDELRKQDG